MAFSNVSKAEWLAKVEKDLKGKPLSGLNFELAGETMSPFWHGDDLPESPPPLTKSPGWKIGVQILEQDVTKANAVALEALTGGAESLWFSFYRPKSEAEKATLLKDVLTDIVDIVIDEEESRGGRGSIALDLHHATKRPEKPPTFFVRPGADFYETVATCRAVRLCWQLITDTLEVTTPCHLTAFLPRLNGEDGNMNKISSTVAAVAAVCGGVDTLFIAPSEGSATAFSRRIARNVQHLLREESYLDRVADPAAGSYFLENLTETIARQLWAKFQQL